jgi:hypothetical protein
MSDIFSMPRTLVISSWRGNIGGDIGHKQLTGSGDISFRRKEDTIAGSSSLGDLRDG